MRKLFESKQNYIETDLDVGNIPGIKTKQGFYLSMETSVTMMVKWFFTGLAIGCVLTIVCFRIIKWLN